MIAVDASTLILLAKTELLDLFLESFPKKPFISVEVEKESTRKESFDALLIKERVKEKKILVRKVKSKKLVHKIERDFKLHQGEAETLALCIENKWNLIGTDDYNAIKACIVLKIKYTSAIGILLKLNKEKKLNEKEAILKLKRLDYFGRYSEEIIDEVKNRLR
jgi:predicted nucleic acid-binding protein